MSNTNNPESIEVGKPQEPSRFQRDNDGHWYLIPEAHLGQFEKWVEAMESDDDWFGWDYNACRIDGPGRIRILQFEHLE